MPKYYNTREMKKRDSNIMSTSVPLATQIYKANSDDLKSRKKANKKSKKSVLTLPNESSLFPKVCTVSDVNESEYKRIDGVRWKQKYGTATKLKKKPNRSKHFKIYDEVSQFYSKLKIDLDCGAVPKSNKLSKGNTKRNHSTDMSGECKANDIWALLRNLNRFQLRPTPTMSETSTEHLKKNRSLSKRRNRNDSRLIETCHTEEIAFSFGLKDESSNTLTQSTSFDRMTVIDKRNKLQKPFDIARLQTSPKQYRYINVTNTKDFPNSKTNNYLTIAHNPVMKLSQKNKRSTDEKTNMAHTTPSNNHKNTVLVNSTHPSKTESFNRKQPNVADDDEYLDKSSKTSTECIHTVKGITKVVVKGNEKSFPGASDQLRRKPRLVTTITNSGSKSKLPQTLTRKKLANMKFPIIILHKDQVNPVKVTDYEFPQFSGLDQHVWPFMRDWFDKVPVKRVKERNQKKPDDPTIQKCDIQKKDNDCSMSIKNHTVIEQNKKNNDIYQLKDKMIKLLYKKSQIANVTEPANVNICSPKAISNLIKNHVTIGTKPKILHKAGSRTCNSRLSERTVPRNARIPSPEAKLPQVLAKTFELETSHSKPNWSKEFIESVVRNIKNGIYYNQESPFLINVKVDTQFEKDREDTKSENVVLENEILEELEKTESAISVANIPGFDDPLPALEILTLTDNRIAIKQCLTNITMQFDIVLPLKENTLQNTGVMVPVLLNSSNDAANANKCNTTILNAVLPAELCSIVPKMLHELSVNSAKVAISSVEINKTHSQLSTISELSRCDSLIAQPRRVITVGMKFVFGGKYSRHMPLQISGLNNYTARNICHLYNVSFLRKILPEVKVPNFILHEQMNLPRVLYLKCETGIRNSPKPTCIVETNNFTSTDLKLKTLDSLHIKESYGKFNFGDFVAKILSSNNLMITVNIQNFSNLLSRTTEDKHNKIIVQFTMNLCNNKTSHLNACNVETVQNSLNRVHTKKQAKNFIPIKIRKRNYFRLYKKCKSTSNITVRKASTPLDDINNIEQFFQVFGSDKIICSVFDGIMEKKIMACLSQMRNWITEITSVQAMLVLLLLNRKDSTNLIRLRSILLQAISVNRITRANELDMEVEVIENEQFKMPFEYTQIPYKPAAVTVANADNEKLLEELCWIAKTTASDYQRTYDDSSEKLLKSLINKRKKLNPSYLRVMARYVGLGLLKSPIKL